MRKSIFLVLFILAAMTSTSWPAEPSGQKTGTRTSDEYIPEIYIEDIDLSGISIVTSDVFEDEEEVFEIKKKLSRKIRLAFAEKLNDVAFIVNNRPENGLILDMKFSGRYNEAGMLESLMDSEPGPVTLFMDLKLTDAATGETVLAAEDEGSRVIKTDTKLFDRNTEDKQLNAWYEMIDHWAAMLANDIRSGKHIN